MESLRYRYPLSDWSSSTCNSHKEKRNALFKVAIRTTIYSLIIDELPFIKTVLLKSKKISKLIVCHG